MSRQKPEKKMNKALEIASNAYGPQIAVPPEADGKKKIIFSDDILSKFLEWVPLESLPNVIQAGRRFWFYGDANLEKRKYVIQRLYLTEDLLYGYHLQVAKRTTIDGKALKFAEVAPPMNFQLKAIEISQDIDEQSKAMDFLRISERLFDGAELTFKYYYEVDTVRKFLQVFDRCAEISLENSFSSVVKNLFSKPFNCNSLALNYIIVPDCVKETLFDWLHSPVTIYPDKALPNHKQLYFSTNWGVLPNLARGLLTKLISRIKEKFLELEDSGKQLKFVVKFSEVEQALGGQQLPLQNICPIFRLENSQTGEILFSRFEESKWQDAHDFNTSHDYDLIRCSIGDEATMAYDEDYAKDCPKITIA